jgi:hypothetical protein
MGRTGQWWENKKMRARTQGEKQGEWVNGKIKK